jgi:GxxExxY protein
MSNKIVTTERTEFTETRKGLNELTEIVIGCAIEVHRALGPGLLESTYEMCLCRELSLRNIPFERQKPIPVIYKGVKLDCGYRADVVVDGSVLVEIKAIEFTIASSRSPAIKLSQTRRLESWFAYQLQCRALKTRNPPTRARIS